MKVYEGDTFTIHMHRYSDPTRECMARNCAIYLGRPDRHNRKRPLNIIRDGHVAEFLRAERVEFEFIDVSKEVYDHLVTYTTRTHRIAGGLRANESDGFTMPKDAMKNPDLVYKNYQKSMQSYQELLEAGERPQVARGALGASGHMPPFVLGFNFLTLAQAVFPQRIWERGAQGNTVKVAEGMWHLVHEQDPELWDMIKKYYGPEMVAWRKAFTNLESKNETVGAFISKLIDPKITAELAKNEAGKALMEFLESVNFKRAIYNLYGNYKTPWD